MGDTIDLVNAQNGEVYASIIGFYFGEAFGRTAITNASGAQVKRLDYLYTRQNSHSLGSAVVVKTEPVGSGSPGLKLTAQMQWITTPDGTEVSRILTGTLRTTGVFKPLPPARM